MILSRWAFITIISSLKEVLEQKSQREKKEGNFSLYVYSFTYVFQFLGECVRFCFFFHQKIASVCCSRVVQNAHDRDSSLPLLLLGTNSDLFLHSQNYGMFRFLFDKMHAFYL